MKCPDDLIEIAVHGLAQILFFFFNCSKDIFEVTPIHCNYTVAVPPGVVPGVVPAGGVPAGPGVPGCGAPSGGVGFSN